MKACASRNIRVLGPLVKGLRGLDKPVRYIVVEHSHGRRALRLAIAQLLTARPCRREAGAKALPEKLTAVVKSELRSVCVSLLELSVRRYELTLVEVSSAFARRARGGGIRDADRQSYLVASDLLRVAGVAAVQFLSADDELLAAAAAGGLAGDPGADDRDDGAVQEGV